MMVLSKQKLLALRALLDESLRAMDIADYDETVAGYSLLWLSEQKSARRWIRYIDRTLERDHAS